MTQLVKLSEQVNQASSEAPKVVQTFKEQIAQNKRFKLNEHEECKKLGYALGRMEKFIQSFDLPVQGYIERLRAEKPLFLECEANCKKSKSGNFTPWLLQGYIRAELNKA